MMPRWFPNISPSLRSGHYPSCHQDHLISGKDLLSGCVVASQIQPSQCLNTHAWRTAGQIPCQQMEAKFKCPHRLPDPARNIPQHRGAHFGEKPDQSKHTRACYSCSGLLFKHRFVRLGSGCVCFFYRCSCDGCICAPSPVSCCWAESWSTRREPENPRLIAL